MDIVPQEPTTTKYSTRELIDRIRSNFPEELQWLDQWVVWRIEERDSKPTKVPYTARGALASSTDPATWTTFESAADAYQRGNYDGVGFVFYEGDPYAGVDLDKCVTDGVMDPQRAEWMERLDSYSEYSPTETGVHVFVIGKLPPGRRKSTDHRVEMYDEARFFTVTGDRVPGTPPTIIDRDAQLKALHAEIFPPKNRPEPKAAPDSPPEIPSDDGVNNAHSDHELLNLMFASKKGANIRALWDGETGNHNGDASAADQALCNHLAFWTGRNAQRMDRMFRESKLMRDKWDRNARTGETYGEGTIRIAIEGCAEIYNPAPTIVWGTNGDSAGSATATADKSKKDTQPTSEKTLGALAELGYTFAWNELDDTIEVNGERLNAGLEAQIRTQMRDRGYKGMEALQDVWTATAYTNRYHPVKRILEEMEWDGQNHIASLAGYIKDAHPMIIYPNGQKSSVFLIWFVRWAVGAIAKLYETDAVRGQNPMLVLDGAQGKGKSTFVRWLASPFAGLFIEDAIRPDDREHDRYLTSKFIWEVSELGATTRRADREALKAFITKGEATFRKPYDRNPIVKPALASFVGTINNETGFLTDRTGNRRYLSVTLASIDWGYVEALDPKQIWAQAYHLYRQGERWTLSETETKMRDALNEGYEMEDALEGWVSKISQIDPERDDWRATSAELAEALQNWGYRGTTRAIQMELGSTLKSMGLRQGTNARPRQWVGIQITTRLKDGD